MTKPTERPIRDTAAAIEEAAAKIGAAADSVTAVLTEVLAVLRRVEALFAMRHPENEHMKFAAGHDPDLDLSQD